MRYLKAFVAVIMGLEKQPSTGDTIGVLVGLFFIITMLILTTGVFG